MKRLRGRELRRRRIKKKLFGTQERPRMAVYRSIKNLSAQLIDDAEQRTILSLSTFSTELRKDLKYGGNIKAAVLLGNLLAKKAKEKGITKVVFDRSGYPYHGRIKALAESASKNGLSFTKKEGAKDSGGKKDRQ
jgi:large subunit ribosomal protein L18